MSDSDSVSRGGTELMCAGTQAAVDIHGAFSRGVGY
jgi:hypothetical protein